MTRNTDLDDEPIHTSTRVPPVESLDRVRRSTVGTEASQDEDPIAATRVPPAVTRFG